MNDTIATLIRERGLLLEKSLFELLTSFSDLNAAKAFLDTLEKASGQKMITSSHISKHSEFVYNAVKTLPGQDKKLVETTFVKLGLHIEIRKETQVSPQAGQGVPFQIYYGETRPDKKLEVSDFVNHFRSRYQQLQRVLMQRTEVQNPVSIGKLGSARQKATIIAIVTDKRVTANKNLILTVEDLTGKVTALVRAENECFSVANELQLDDIVAFKVSGNNEIVFVQEIIWPDSFREKVRFDEDTCVAFISDIHAGSIKHLGEQFERFLAWINSDDELAKKISYLFIVGDNVDGVSVFPGQERVLTLKSLHQQYALLSSYLRKIPSHIQMFMCPGQHDSVRVAEPQPVIDNYYGKELYSIPNLTLVPNPTMIKLFEGEKEFRVLMYHGASIHTFINEIEELRMLKAHRCPAKAVRHMLKRRHLAPTHSAVVYVPNPTQDPLVISESPDVLCTGEVHRLDIENYNGTLIITGSCWQSQTDFEEKVGNIPDPCKVPVLNLKTRELKVLDFSDHEHQ